MAEIEYVTTIATRNPIILRTTCLICRKSFRSGFGNLHERWMKKHSARHLADTLAAVLIREEDHGQ